MSDESLICSFCSKSRKDVTKMIVGASKTSICNECVKLCVEILDEDNVKARKEKLYAGDKNILNPVIIKEHLDQYVIGQDAAKTVLSVAVANHYKRIVQPPIDFDLDKSNVMILGATGAGKTLMARTIAKYLDVPFAIADATTLTESGYVGEDVENVSGEGVQQGLLKIVEGTQCRVPPHGGRKHPDQQTVTIDTSDILFIVGGAFTELEKQIRSKQSGGMGFGTKLKEQDDRNYLTEVRPEDLIKYGLIPEFVGRFSMLTSIDPLSEKQLIRILTEPKNAILKQTKYLFGLDNIDIEFTKEARASIAKKAKDLGTNARGLKNIVDNVVLPYQFDADEMRNRGVSKIQITNDVVDTGADPVLVFKKTNGISKKQN